MSVASRTLLFVAVLTASRAAVAQRSPATVAVTHVHVIPMTGEAPRQEQTVLLRGDRIVDVGPGRSIRIPRGSRVIDAKGRYLVPGLWDMHAHVLDDSTTRALYFPLYVANGVTGLRVMIGDCDSLCAGRDSAGFAPPASVVQGWKRDIAAGTLVGPRLVAAGNSLEGTARFFPQSRSIRDSADAVAAVEVATAHRADFVKVIGNIPPSAYYVLLRTARAARLPVAGHIPAGVSPIEASDSGQRSIEHLWGARWLCTSRPDSLATLRAARDTSAARRAELSRAMTHLAASTVDEAACQPYFRHLVRNGTWQVPTLSPPRNIGLLDRYVERDDPYAVYLTSKQRAEWLPKNDPQLRDMTPEDFASTREQFAGLLPIVAAMWRAKVPLLAGSDVGTAHIYPGFGLIEELSYLVDAGLTPYAALEAATISPARFFGATDSLGTIAPGKRADLVLVDANPLEDIHNISHVAMVVLRGRVLERRELDGLLRNARAFAKAH
jgi:imidazolonepropionase-like amidohydrolase